MIPHIHKHFIVLGQDGDYVVWASLRQTGEGLDWVEHTRWLIPGTQLED